jgi:hypothetical protein
VAHRHGNNITLHRVFISPNLECNGDGVLNHDIVIVA